MGIDRDISFQIEDFSKELFDEVYPLLEKHYHEVAHFQDIPLNPDFDAYMGAHNNDLVRFFTARRNGELVGYCIFFVKTNAHYKDSLQAQQDVLFIDPSIRKTGVGFFFLQYCDENLRKEGVQAVYHHMKAGLPFNKLLESLNYELVDLIYARRLDKE